MSKELEGSLYTANLQVVPRASHFAAYEEQRTHQVMDKEKSLVVG